MKDTNHLVAELGQAASQVLIRARKMARRGDSLWQIENYLKDCHTCFLQTALEAQRWSRDELLQDMTRALRYARPNSELLGTLAVLAALSNQEGVTNFHCFSLAAQQLVRSVIRDFLEAGAGSSDDIRLGAELALSSLKPLIAA